MNATRRQHQRSAICRKLRSCDSAIRGAIAAVVAASLCASCGNRVRIDGTSTIERQVAKCLAHQADCYRMVVLRERLGE